MLFRGSPVARSPLGLSTDLVGEMQFAGETLASLLRRPRNVFRHFLPFILDSTRERKEPENKWASLLSTPEARTGEGLLRGRISPKERIFTKKKKKKNLGNSPRQVLIIDNNRNRDDFTFRNITWLPRGALRQALIVCRVNDD